MGTQLGVITTMLLGQVIVGGMSSASTTTLKQQETGAGTVGSFTSQQTSQEPGRKTLPEGGLQLIAGAVGEQGLVAVTL